MARLPTGTTAAATTLDPVVGLILAAFAPGLFWLWFFLRLDRIRPEPRRLIALTFLLGCVATLPAGLGNYLFGAEALLDGGLSGAPELISVVTAMLVVGPVEELCKFGAVRLGAYRSLYFDEPADGLVYAATASLGFASLENLIYVLDYGPAVMLARAPISTLAHLVFGSIWGQALGQYYASAGSQRLPWLKRLLPLICSLALAAGAHALFNVMIFVFVPAALALVLAGAIWAYRAFRQGQRSSPFRLRRNYPRVSCPRCGKPGLLLHRFCSSCGVSAPRPAARQALLCSHCGNSNRPDASYCTRCGDQLLRR